jgi:hypothetical protein
MVWDLLCFNNGMMLLKVDFLIVNKKSHIHNNVEILANDTFVRDLGQSGDIESLYE